MDIYNPPKRGGSTLNQAPQSLGTCQGRKSYTLAYQILFLKWRFQTSVPSPSKGPRVDVSKGVNSYKTYREGGHTKGGDVENVD